MICIRVLFGMSAKKHVLRVETTTVFEGTIKGHARNVIITNDEWTDGRTDRQTDGLMDESERGFLYVPFFSGATEFSSCYLYSPHCCMVFGAKTFCFLH